MKRILFLLTLMLMLFSSSPFLYGENEVFPKSDAIWVIHAYGGEAPLQVIYGLKGDTLINNINYQKLYLLNDTTLNIDREDIFVAGIRQADKKVWVQPADKKDGTRFDEFLMYDFSKTEGEIIEFGKRPDMLMYGKSHITFENIDLNSIYNETGDVFMVGEESVSIRCFSSLDIWVNGVGGLGGLFFLPVRLPSCCGSPSGGQLICMKHQDEIKYLAEGCTSCFEQDFKYSSLEESIKEQVSINYNSRNKTIEIDFSEFSPEAQFSLYTNDGKLVETFPLTDTQTSFNTATLYSGLYLYKVEGDDLHQSGKLIIE